jgi:hypothetical protein
MSGNPIIDHLQGKVGKGEEDLNPKKSYRED